jgi:SAM-dependent methyltransferase
MGRNPKRGRESSQVVAEAKLDKKASDEDDESNTEPAYGSRDYWDQRYANPETSNHEWYFGYDTLQPLVHELLPARPSDQWSALEVGCGDRPILPDLVADPHFANCRAICFDYAPTVVRALRHAAREAARSNPALPVVSYEQADARSLSYSNESFDIVLDKGTIDAMMCSISEGVSNAQQICSEAARVVSPGGVIVIVSHMNPTGDEGSVFLSKSLLPALSDKSAKWSWDVGVHFNEASEESGPFVYVVRKTRRRLTRAALKQDQSPEIPVELHAY